MRLLLALLFTLLVTGCSQKRFSEESAQVYGPAYAESDFYDYDEVASDSAVATSSRGSGGSPKMAKGAPMAPPPPPPPPGAAPAPSPRPRPAPAPAPAQPEEPDVVEVAAAKRLVHYDGHAQIRATKPSDLIEAVEALAAELGGRVDQLYGLAITIRVPVERFREAWDRTLELGDVLSQSVRADDITDQFLAVDLRVRTLRTTRDRLIALLAKATEEEEKLVLLAQITRVSEELDGFESALRVLGDLAAMSRITVEVVPRERFVGNARPDHYGFHWIAQITPFRRAVFDDLKRIGLQDTEGLVSLSKKGPFVAESADGTVLWTFRIANDPIGEGPFWVEAIKERLAEQFTNLTDQKVGAWSCLNLDEAGADEPYRWAVCVQPDGKHLKVAQVFYPSPEQVERYSVRIEAALKADGADS